ncbi:hypothetical protein RDI58_001028 [Solanum bulbocastanum]|uniref:Uncharacterized protein n=1 Tax=Solanum bulbocastanum TaxID=147425 RepID=A0AAN8U4B6_SOLBU
MHIAMADGNMKNLCNDMISMPLSYLILPQEITGHFHPALYLSRILRNGIRTRTGRIQLKFMI